MKPLKKIYYVPGLISAVVVPILFWYYGNQKHQEINVGVIDIGLPAKLDSVDKLYYQYPLGTVRNWHYKKIVVEPILHGKILNISFLKLKNYNKTIKKKLELNLFLTMIILMMI